MHLTLLVFPLLFFLLHVPPSTQIYTLSLHDALPISHADRAGRPAREGVPALRDGGLRSHRARRVGSRHQRRESQPADRKSTRLNSSHRCISYAVFCLKKKKKKKTIQKKISNTTQATP